MKLLKLITICIIGIFTSLGVFTLIIFLSEPSYYNQIFNGIIMKSAFDYENFDGEILGDIKGELNLGTAWNNNYGLRIPLDKLQTNPVKIDILEGDIKYIAYYENLDFNSVFSRPKYRIMDYGNLGSIGELYHDCVIFSYDNTKYKKGESCKYTSTSRQFFNGWYKNLFIILYVDNGSTGKIKIQ